MFARPRRRTTRIGRSRPGQTAKHHWHIAAGTVCHACSSPYRILGSASSSMTPTGVPNSFFDSHRGAMNWRIAVARLPVSDGVPARHRRFAGPMTGVDMSHVRWRCERDRAARRANVRTAVACHDVPILGIAWHGWRLPRGRLLLAILRGKGVDPIGEVSA